MLLAVLEPLGERVGEAGGPDRSGCARHVVLRPTVGEGPSLGVHERPRTAPVAVARLADRSRVEEPFTIGDVELVAALPGLAGGRLAGHPAEGERDVRV